ncbi:serine hydrolase domain-containing protein [Sphingosinicella rhizophila]|uniref:Serine hydrolase domain-containing protein n=1 Tax=Sphingosinicella rhizophila TaxID=3050082 RepID=A0ABU3Q5P2_9SPHN|nr:serine hydrolase domain-containing protein [Sphingosinicella sp. GR2756]MDT9598730.1 serine hydrolase domain-containing protein [Sphingosinicella sp. GR2756]
MNRTDFDRRSLLTATAVLGAAALFPKTLRAADAVSKRYETMDGITGLVEKGWEPVADIIRANLKNGKEVGTSCCVYLDGHPVVDIWGGLADSKTGRKWERETVTVLASTTKGAVAICAHLLVQRGKLDLEAPVAKYWPEFGQAGKETIPVRYLLAHQAGLPLIDTPVTFEETAKWGPMIHAFEVQKPLWEPGTEHLYHAESFGYLVGELVRRVSGKTIGKFFHEEIAVPLGLTAWIGMPEEYEPLYSQREWTIPSKSPEVMVAEFSKAMGFDPAVAAALMQGLYAPDSAFMRAGQVGAVTPEIFLSRAYRAGEFPASNMVANARSLARMYAATVSDVDGIRILRADTVAKATEVQTDRSRMHGVPEELQPYTKKLFNMSLGFWRPTLPVNPMLGPNSFGHPGSGGSLGAADPESRVAFGYVPNYAEIGLLDPRASELTAAVRKCLGKA